MAELKEKTDVRNNTRYKTIAVILSIISPGLGHLYAGSFMRGIIAIIIYYISIILFLIAGSLLSKLFYLLSIVPFVLIIIDSVFETGKKSEYRLKSYNRWYYYILYLFLFAIFNSTIVAPFVQYNLLQTFEFPTGSMENTILKGDKVIVSKLSYGIHSPLSDKYIINYNNIKRGDLVVFIFQGDRDEKIPKEYMYYCQRCIGLPGDTIKVDDKKLYLNNNLFPNPKGVKFISPLQNKQMVNQRIFPRGAQWNEDNYGPIRVPKTGDKIHIDTSNYYEWKVFIQREGNEIKIDRGNKIFIDGKELEDGTYTVKRDYIFTMGDNRNNCLDGRYWGFIPVEAVTGKLKTIYWSWDKNIPLYEFIKRTASIRWDRIFTDVE